MWIKDTETRINSQVQVCSVFNVIDNHPPLIICIIQRKAMHVWYKKSLTSAAFLDEATCFCIERKGTVLDLAQY